MQGCLASVHSQFRAMPASSHARGGMFHGERRRLRRQPSLKARPVELAQMHCIRGCRGRDWILLPCIDVQGRDCVQLTVGSAWLQQCLGVRRQRGPWRGVVRSLMVECLNAFESSKESGHDDAPVEHNKPSQPHQGASAFSTAMTRQSFPPSASSHEGVLGRGPTKMAHRSQRVVDRSVASSSLWRFAT